jgi:O-antigen ligase
MSDSPLIKLNNALLIVYASVVALALGWMVFANSSTSTIIGLGAVLVIAPIFLLKTEYGLYALLIFRPVIDLFSSYTIISVRSLTLNLNAVVAILVLVWFVIVVIRERVYLQQVPGLGWLASFLLWGLATYAVTINSFLTTTEWLRISSVVVIYIIAYHVAVQRPHALTRLTPVVAIGLILPLLMATIQLVTTSGLSFGGLENRVYGTFGHPNVLAFYLVCALNLLLIYQFAQRKAQRSLIYPWLIGIGLVMLLFTYTRGAWLGFALVQIVLGWMYYRKQLVISLVIIAGLLFSWQIVNAVSISTFNYDLNSIDLVHRLTARDDEADSIDWRLEVYRVMAPKTLQSPLLGYGLGNFVTLRKQGDIGLFDDPEAHNDYLRLAIESGFIGISLYVLFWISVLLTLVRHMKSHQEASWQRRYAVFGCALVLAVLGMSLSDNLLQGTAVIWTYLAVLATILAETKPILAN